MKIEAPEITTDWQQFCHIDFSMLFIAFLAIFFYGF